MVLTKAGRNASRNKRMRRGQLQTVYPVLWNAYPSALSVLTAPGKRLQVSNYCRARRNALTAEEFLKEGVFQVRGDLLFTALCSFEMANNKTELKYYFRRNSRRHGFIHALSVMRASKESSCARHILQSLTFKERERERDRIHKETSNRSLFVMCDPSDAFEHQINQLWVTV